MLRIIIVFIFILALSGLNAQDKTVLQVNSREFHKLISGNSGVLLDVRTSSEFKNGHIADAGQLNFYALDFKRKLSLLPANEPIYLYCNTGYRSDKAAEFLVKNGYTQVYNLQHGIMEWDLMNLPVIVEPDANPDTDNKMLPDQYFALRGSESLVFFDFYAPWCGPCREMMPMIDSLKVEYHERISIYKVNVDASKKLVKELQLIGVPYLLLQHNGKVLFSRNGAISRSELTELLEKHIIEKSDSKIVTSNR